MLRFAPLLCLLFLGCDATSLGELQRVFELDAITAPIGITETDARGNVLREDPDDWRPSPIYRSQFNLTFTPYPNPASPTESIQFAATFAGTSGGLVPYRLNAQGDLAPIQAVTGNTSGSAPLFSFPAGQLGSQGIHRVVLLDFQSRVVSYGDVLLIP